MISWKLSKSLKKWMRRTRRSSPKFENQEGVQNAEEILKVCSGLMVARGDLGLWKFNGGDVPIVQKDLIRKCNLAGKQVITATQMLDSMQWNPRPTRVRSERRRERHI